MSMQRISYRRLISVSCFAVLGILAVQVVLGLSVASPQSWDTRLHDGIFHFIQKSLWTGSRKGKGDGTLFHTYTGPIGDQLFQWATMSALAKSQEMSTCLRGGSLDIFFLGIQNECTLAHPWTSVEESEVVLFAHDFQHRDTTVFGRLQSYRGFENSLRSRVQFIPVMKDIAMALLEHYSEKVLIGIHLKKYGDRSRKGPNREYYENAMQYFKSRYENVGFIVITDDFEWCSKQRFLKRDDVHIVLNNPHPAVDMAVLVACAHIVINDSTFGWWSAYFGADARIGGVVIFFKDELIEGPKDYYPTSWIPLSNSEISVMERGMPVNANNTVLKYGDATIVTAFFKDESRFSHAQCSSWMYNLLSLQDPMIIFTTADMEYKVYSLRKHASNRTQVIVTTLEDTEMVRRYGMKFWEDQRNADPEKDLHQDVSVYIVWNEKVSFLRRAVLMNPFYSSIFVWAGMHGLRTSSYNYQRVITDATPFLGDKVFMLDMTKFTRHVLYDIFRENTNRVSGFMFGGTKIAIGKYYSEYYTTLSMEIHQKNFVGKEQTLIWKTCQRVQNLCNMIVPESVPAGLDVWAYLIPYLLSRQKKLSNMIQQNIAEKHTREKKRDTLIRLGDATIVTCHFRYVSEEGDDGVVKYMSNVLSLNDAMIIFTTEDMVSSLYELRKHALNLTHIIVTKLQHSEILKKYNTDFWIQQRSIDDNTDKMSRRDPRLYVMRNSKVAWLKTALHENPFRSSYFVWMDIDLLRDSRYNGKTMLTNSFPFHTDKIVMLDVKPELPSTLLNILFENENHVQTSMIGGSAIAIRRYYSEYYKTLSKIEPMFIGNDKTNSLKTCRRVPDLCSLIPNDMWYTEDRPEAYLVPFLMNTLWKSPHTE